MQNLMQKEADWLKQEKLAQIKRQRLENLFAYYEDPDIVIDQV